MKKILSLAVVVGSVMAFVPAANAISFMCALAIAVFAVALASPVPGDEEIAFGAMLAACS